MAFCHSGHMATEPRLFEQRVADVFRALGARVTHDIEVEGHQIDVLVVETTPSGVDVTVAVECKYYQAVVGKDLVTKFANVVDALRVTHMVHFGLMVAERGFSHEAYEAARGRHVELRDMADLETRPELALMVASEAVREVIGQADRLKEVVHQALGSLDALSAFDWQDLHADVEKVLTSLNDAARLHQRNYQGSMLDRRARSTIMRVCEHAERCLDAIWYLRMVTLQGDEGATRALGVSESDRMSSSLLRLRELEQARGQLRGRLRQLDEACMRAGMPR